MRTPSACRSLRPSRSFCAAICSGLMYRGDPSIAPVCVRAIASAPLVSIGASLLMPKSSSLGTIPPPWSRWRNTFAGLRSRWMTPLSCARRSARVIAAATSNVKRTGRPPGLSAPSRATPWSSSITRNGAPFSSGAVPTSKISRMFG